MQSDFDEAEILFAQKLANCDAKIRRNALAKLKRFISARLRFGKAFSHEHLIKIWKGLYYCLWMQDKPLIQEELVDNLSRLLAQFRPYTDQIRLFALTFYQTLAREWYTIDRWRMDKFMMFMRRFLRQEFKMLQEDGWVKDDISATITTWQSVVLSADPEMPEGLKYHFASIYMDELDFAGAETLSEDQVMDLMWPYIEILSIKLLSDYFFGTICKEIFETILLQFSQSLAHDDERSDERDEANASDKTAVLKIPYGRIADALMDVGKSRKMLNERRHKVYELVKRFNLAAKGDDPLQTEEYASSDEDSFGVSDTDIDEAAKFLVRHPIKLPKKLKRRKAKYLDLNSDDNNLHPEIALQRDPEDFRLKPGRVTAKSKKERKTSDGKRKSSKRRSNTPSASNVEPSCDTVVGSSTTAEAAADSAANNRRTRIQSNESAVAAKKRKLAKHKGRYFSPAEVAMLNSDEPLANEPDKKEPPNRASGKRRQAKPKNSVSQDSQRKLQTKPEFDFSTEQMTAIDGFVKNPPVFVEHLVSKMQRRSLR